MKPHGPPRRHHEHGPYERAETRLRRHFQLVRRIGRGSFGSVYKVIRRCDRSVYALKRVDLRGANARLAKDALNEVRLLASLRHPHIVQFLEAFPDGRHRSDMRLCIVMEYARRGDLTKDIAAWRQRGRVMPELRVWRFARQLSDALQFLHSHGILHRDVKAANCFLTDESTVKLGDLNISKLAGRGQLARTHAGTPYYMSPEIYAHLPYGTKSDVWALGILLYELGALRVPFTGYSVQDLSMRVRTANYVRRPHTHYAPALWNLVRTMLMVRPDARPTMGSVMATASLQTEHGDKEGGGRQAQETEATVDMLRTIRMMPTVQQLSERMPASQYTPRIATATAAAAATATAAATAAAIPMGCAARARLQAVNMLKRD